jgi:hypothetical protein
MNKYEFWDKENGFYGYDKYSLNANQSTKKVQKILKEFINKGYKYSLSCTDTDLYPITTNTDILKIAQSIDDDTCINIYKDRECIGCIDFQPYHNANECISDYSCSLDDIVDIENC